MWGDRLALTYELHGSIGIVPNNRSRLAKENTNRSCVSSRLDRQDIRPRKKIRVRG